MIYEIIDTRTGNRANEYELVQEPWAEKTHVCDWPAFAVEEDGDVMLTDDCGNYDMVPEGRVEVRLVVDREKWKPLRVNAVPEHGQSLELPCKVGDRLRLEARGTCYYTVTSLLVLVTQQETRIVIDVLDDAGNSDYFFSESIGKTVFRVDRGQRQKEEV